MKIKNRKYYTKIFTREYGKRPREPYCGNKYPEKWVLVLQWEEDFSGWLIEKIGEYSNENKRSH